MSTSSKQPLPPCPHCQTAAQVIRQGEMYHCRRCRGLFDDEPDEGGTHSDDPTRRIECEESRAKRRPIPSPGFRRRRR